MSVGFCRESRVEGIMSRVEGKMSRVEGKMSRVKKCRQFIYYHLLVMFFIITFYNSFFVS